MNLEDKYMNPNETQRVQHDLKQILDQCDGLFTKIAEQEHDNTENLRSAFLMMADMGYTANEAKEEFTRFQAQFNADTSEQPDTSGGSQVNVRRRRQTASSSPGYSQSHKHGLTGVKRFGHVLTLCLAVIPILFLVGIVTEIWFSYNPWGRACFYVRYVKAALYIGVWYAMLSACMHTTVAKVLSVLFCFAGIGMVPGNR